MGLPLYEWIKDGHGWSPAIEYYCGAIKESIIVKNPIYLPRWCYVDRSYGYS